MKIAFFSDLHGNLAALQAVLEDIDRREVDMAFCGGDLVGYGAFPNEVIDLLRLRHWPVIMGNYDQGVGQDADDCGCAYRDEVSRALGQRSIAWTKKRVTAGNKAYLRNLPTKIGLVINGKKILMVHGSPRRINEYLFEDRPVSAVARLFQAEEAEVIICGHTHLPYIRGMIVEESRETGAGPAGQTSTRLLPGGHFILINGGSVGKPKDGDPRASYALIDYQDGNWQNEIIRVGYDVETMARAIEQSGLPVEYAEQLRLGH
ncbi:MAG TPA: metallophosphoesterase family protein [Candidatus Saccharicenans sp.]|nr:metallophosphoesterase family protein [Candidatus Saccharicenans sp.]HRV06801.1 metallophosphoesterase family protein [Candidatus Saccharicenans sp.]